VIQCRKLSGMFDHIFGALGNCFGRAQRLCTSDNRKSVMTCGNAWTSVEPNPKLRLAARHSITGGPSRRRRPEDLDAFALLSVLLIVWNVPRLAEESTMHPGDLECIAKPKTEGARRNTTHATRFSRSCVAPQSAVLRMHPWTQIARSWCQL